MGKKGSGVVIFVVTDNTEESRSVPGGKRRGYEEEWQCCGG